MNINTKIILNNKETDVKYLDDKTVLIDNIIETPMSIFINDLIDELRYYQEQYNNSMEFILKMKNVIERYIQLNEKD